MCAKWQWNALDWCYWIAPQASPVMQHVLSNTTPLWYVKALEHNFIFCVKTTVKGFWKMRSNDTHFTTYMRMQLRVYIDMYSSIIIRTRDAILSNYAGDNSKSYIPRSLSLLICANNIVKLNYMQPQYNSALWTTKHDLIYQYVAVKLIHHT